MLRFYAAKFTGLISNMMWCYMACFTMGEPEQKIRQTLRETLPEMRNELRRMEFPLLASQTERLIKGVDILSREQLGVLITELRDGIRETFGQQVFLKLNYDYRAGYVRPQPNPIVADAFPDIVPEFEDATRSIALEQPNGAVFHSMRVLEAGLTSVAAKFGVETGHRNWENIINDIESAIRGMNKSWGANWKEEQQFYSDAALHFRTLKNAWRNYVMHLHHRYSPNEAIKIYHHVSDFMLMLSQKITGTPVEMKSQEDVQE